MRKILTAIVALLLFCGTAYAAKYEISDDQQKFLIAMLSQVQIRGADAPMLLQAAQALQKPIVEKKEPI